MQSQDSYRLKLQQLAASIKAWSGFVADVARVEVSEDNASWRFALQPFAAGACPIELTLHGAAPRCDLRIGGLSYQDWPLPSLDTVLPLMEAVTEGNVISRRTISAATGLQIGVTTEIKLADGRVLEPPSDALPDGLAHGSVESRVTHYLPYRRPGKAR